LFDVEFASLGIPKPLLLSPPRASFKALASIDLREGRGACSTFDTYLKTD